MPRRVEDIVPSDKRSIRNIPREKLPPKEPVKRSPMLEQAAMASEYEEVVPIQRIKIPPTAPLALPTQPVLLKESPKKRRRGLWLLSSVLVILLIAGAGYIASIYFSRAKFTIVPVTIPVNVSRVTIVATATSTPGYLRYEVLTYSQTASTTIPASDGPYISTKAAGTLTVYNSFSNQPQRLIAGTRFSSNTGKVYRITSSIVIPGYTTVREQIVPGSVSAAIVADEAGAEYNMPLTGTNDDLKVIAYIGAPRYDTIYAKQKTEIAGGFVGTKKTVNPALLASTTKDMQALVGSRLLVQAGAALPEDYVSYDGAYSIVFEAPVTGGTSASKASVTLSGTLYYVVFRRSDLITKLAGEAKLAEFGNSPYRTSGLEELQFTVTNPNNFNPARGTALIARLNGDLTLTGIVPVALIRNKLAGLTLAETKKVMTSYGSVIDVPKSSGELFPSWASTVPRDQSRISIIIVD